MKFKNRYTIFGDVVEDNDTGIYYCLIKATTSINKSKSYVYCLELNNKGINNTLDLEFLQRPPKIFDRATIKDFFFVDNLANKITDYLKAMKINYKEEDVRQLAFQCRYKK